jgi:GNAT superfamily N-acetyltransferase
MLSFDDLGGGNWERYASFILKSEEVFPDGIRTPKEDFIDVVKEGDAIAKVALLESKYVGNIFGYSLLPDETASHGINDVPANSKVIYIFSIVINPEYQGKGYGKQLLWEFIKTAKAKGYDYVAGHFRQNGSLQLIKKFGAKEEGVYHNWENIGEDCIACCLNIHQIQEPLQPELKTDNQSTGLIQMPSPEQAIITPVPNVPAVATDMANQGIEPPATSMHF